MADENRSEIDVNISVCGSIKPIFIIRKICEINVERIIIMNLTARVFPDTFYTAFDNRKFSKHRHRHDTTLKVRKKWRLLLVPWGEVVPS